MTALAAPLRQPIIGRPDMSGVVPLLSSHVRMLGSRSADHDDFRRFQASLHRYFDGGVYDPEAEYFATRAYIRATGLLTHRHDPDFVFDLVRRVHGGYGGRHVPAAASSADGRWLSLLVSAVAGGAA